MQITHVESHSHRIELQSPYRPAYTANQDVNRAAASSSASKRGRATWPGLRASTGADRRDTGRRHRRVSHLRDAPRSEPLNTATPWRNWLTDRRHALGLVRV
jgi:hypothetical protein